MQVNRQLFIRSSKGPALATNMGKVKPRPFFRLFQKRLFISIIILVLFSATLIPSSIRLVAASPTYTSGVNSGSTATYGNVTAFWNNNLTGVTPPPFIAEFLDVASINLAVKNVSGSNVTATQTFTFTNGTAPRASRSGAASLTEKEISPSGYCQGT